MNEFDPDVRDIAHQLSIADFSRESHIRYGLRQRLLAKKRTRHFTPLFRLGAAAALLLLVVFGAGLTLPPSSEVASATEVRLQPTEMVTQNLSSQTRKAYNIAELQASVDYEVYTPQSLPEDYEYYFSWVNGETIKSFFYNKTSFEGALIAQTAYGMNLDYLYLVQLPDQGELGDLPHPFAVGTIRYEVVKSRGKIGIFSATMEDGKSALIALWSDGDWDFQMWSYQLPAEELEVVAASVVPYNEQSPTPAPETTREVSVSANVCTFSMPIWGNNPNDAQGNMIYPVHKKWGMPIGPVSVVRPFSPDHPGVTFGAREGTSIFAPTAAVVYSIRNDQAGDTITLYHDGYFSSYSQVGNVNLECGERVIAGQKIAEVVGTSLYFEIFQLLEGEKQVFDPAMFLEFKADSRNLLVHQSVVFEANAVGSCPSQTIRWDLGNEWRSPISAGNFTVSRRFSASSPFILLEAEEGEAVYAAQDGIVVFAGWSDSGTGQTVILAHGNGYTRYGHLSQVAVGCGMQVTDGSIGRVGMTGDASGSGLRFEVMDLDGQPIDPASVIDFSRRS